MKANEALKLLDDKNFLDTLFRFSYHRCNTAHEAEELCSDIVFTVISAIHRQEEIDNFYAFVWTIARRVYADYCQRRNTEKAVLSIENSDLTLVASKENEIDKMIEKSAEQEQLKRILEEIAFLSKAYREVMILFYLDGLSVKNIAQRLNVKENTVKQRLFSARNQIRKEVKIMNEKAYVLRPIKLAVSGTGDPCGNDPRTKTERSFSQNLIYLCKNKPKTAKELSDELCVPMPFVEEELEIQCRGENETYGMLRKLDNGKFTVNIHLADYDEYDKANQIFERHLPEFCRAIKNALEKNKTKILSFPYLSEQKDLRFIMWSLICRTVWNFKEKINRILAEKYFSDITPVKRDFSCAAVAYTDEQKPDFDFYGCNGINANSVGGYRSVFVSNIYGSRMDAHFYCGHNLSHDPQLLMALKAIGGIPVDTLSETEKEIAAKAIECGYLRKNGTALEPKIIVIDKKNDRDFYNLSFDFNHDMGKMIEQIAAELSVFMRAHIPQRLLNEYQTYTELIAGVRILSKAIEECIAAGILSTPQSRIGAEGMLMIVEK